MDEKLVFRRARPADAARIMEIIRQAQAQAQMRALGSLQWQDGYPAAELHIDSNEMHYRRMELIGTLDRKSVV